MSLITLKFFVFLCILLLLYYLLPKKYQWMLLLAGSLVFYVNSSPYYLVFILVSTFSAYMLGRLLMVSKKKSYMVICVCINLLILGVLKYTGFVFEIFAPIFKNGLPEVNFILPLGISFYTFMIISYIVDVYKGEVDAETNFFKLLLFVSWFPQIIEGPINRYIKMKDRLYVNHDFDFDRSKRAGYRILQGLFKKVVIAGRFGVYVDTVFENVRAYGGLTLLGAMVFYAIQLYADFSGCMDMVLGISELFGIEMEENFDLPFFAKSVAEFWRRWHISLGTWFRDYVYNPVMQSNMSKSLKSSLRNTPFKKWSMNIVAAVALLITWLLTGIWHGGSVKYAFYGAYWGAIIIFSMFMTKTYKKWHKKHPNIYNAKWYAVFQMIRTFILVDAGLMIFRADTLKDAFDLLKGVFTRFSLSVSSISEALLPFTGDNTAVSYGAVAFVSALCLFIVEVFAFNGKDTFKKHKYVNAVVLIVATLLFGVFGQSGFLYMAY